MRNTMRLVTAGLLVALAWAPVAMSQEGYDNRDVVRDTAGDIVHSTDGNCVRTEWETDGDACAPKVVKEEPPRQPVVRRARQLAEEERTVYFDFNKANIRPEEAAKLNNLADILKSDNEVKSVHIVGYADRMGSASYNETLSKHRAKDVENYLHQRDYLNTSLAKVRWLGKSESITQCSSKLKRNALIACLARDRRVVVEIDYYPKH